MDQLYVDLLWRAVGFDLFVDDLDQDALEDCSVEHLAEGRLALGVVVGFAGLREERERVLKGVHDVVNLRDGLGFPTLDLRLFRSDAGLFGLHDVDRDGVAVVELDELLLLGRQFVESPLVAIDFVLGVLSFAADEFANGGAQRILFVGAQPTPALVELYDNVFDGWNGRVGVAAGAGGSDSAQARVVLVGAAEFAAVVPEAETAAADPAVDRAVQVVMVMLGSLAALAVGIHNGLNALKRVDCHECLV